MRFGILGPVEVRADDGPLPIKNGRERFVLALLLLGADRLTPTDRIIDGLWDEPPPTARAQLHNIIRSLRQRFHSIGAELIVTRPLGYELRLGDHELDLLEFRRLVARGRQAAMEGDPARAAAVLDDALALWHGPALADVDERLARDPRRKLHEERAAAAVDLLESQLQLGQPDEVISRLSGLLTDHPHRERLYELQMRALAATGRRAEALDAYQQAYRRLVDDLGVEPGPTLRDLEQQVLQGAEIASAAPTAVTPRQLPAMLTTLTGRDELIADVAGVLGADAPGQARALLVGPGGIGKTTLATAVAHRVAGHFADGQLYADLRGSHTDAADPHDVLAGFLRALGVSGPALPDDADERTALYRSLLSDKHVLVLLDDAADERQVRPLLPGGDGCGVIVTSRQRLNALVDTSRWTVPGLRPTDAVDLVGRIVGDDRVGAEAEAATSIAAACGHLPLAVSIAAARLAAHPEWSLAGYAVRLTDERRRLDELRLGDLDVRASIALSYDALEPDHRRLLRRLGLISAPDWPAWVAHEVDEGLDAWATDAALDHLTDAHLVEPLGRDPVGQTRFRLHDLVAEYAHERAVAEEDESDRTDVVTRVLSGWLALASEADQHIDPDRPTTRGLWFPASPVRALRLNAEMASPWFEVESSNLVGAVADACRIANADLAGGLAIRLSGYLRLRAYDDDLLHALQSARGCIRTAGRDDLLDRILLLLSNLIIESADPAELSEIASEWLAVADRLADPGSVARANMLMSDAALTSGKVHIADDWLNRAVEVARTCDDSWLHADLWEAVAATRLEAGRASDALEAMEQAMDAERRQGIPQAITMYMGNYAEALLANDRLSEAEAALQKSKQGAVAAGDSFWIATSERMLATVDMRRGDWSSAARRLDQIRDLLPKATVDGTAHLDCTVGELALATGQTSDAVEHFGRACRVWRSSGRPLRIARLLARLELAHRAADDAAAADECRREWRAILDDLDLDEACLLLPPFLTHGR